jgi:hypothetical protein
MKKYPEPPKKNSTGFGPVHEKEYIFKGGQLLFISYPNFISLLLQEN